MSNRRKPSELLGRAAFTAFFGALAFYSVSNSPRFATLHVLDVIRLMTAGAGLALTIFFVVRYLKESGEGAG